MEAKKISFGFMKIKKAEKPIVEEKRDFIECVEEKSIKVIGGEEIKENTPLIIPMKPNTLVTAERLKEIAVKVESALEEPEIEEKPASLQEKPPVNETLDQMAIRELLQDAKKEVDVETSLALTVPLPAKPVNEGKKESTLDDYEAVPVQDFGLAMLRGMGWAPGKDKSTYKQPQLRPKGLGLGADKVVKGNQKNKPAKDSKGEELTIVINAFVKITTGKHSGYYGKIVSLDEDMGRVMVDIAVKKEMVSLSEFMMQPVTKAEYDKESKVINAGSFEEYKKKEEQKSKGIEKGISDKINKDTKKADRDVEREASSSRSGESRYDRDEKSSRDVERKYDRDEKSSRDSERKYDRDEKTSRDFERKYDRAEKSSRDSERKYDREEKSSRDVERKYDSDEKLSRNKTEKSSKNGTSNKDDEKRERDRDRSQRKQRRDSTEERCSRKKDKRCSSESLESLSDSEKKSKDRRHSGEDSSSESDRKKKSKKKERRRYDSSDSESDHRSKKNKTTEGKRDIDKKRKGKKKKRDRDRSPNYRKHRK